jgi:mRNA interferase RelE/StbE
MRWCVILTPAAERGLRGLSEEVERRVVRRLRSLRADPRPPGCLKLAGAEGLWRLRVGDYRVIYRIEDAVLVVLVIRVAHRRDVYR